MDVEQEKRRKSPKSGNNCRGFGHTEGKSEEKVQREASGARNLDMEGEEVKKKSKERHLEQEIWTYSQEK